MPRAKPSNGERWGGTLASRFATWRAGGDSPAGDDHGLLFDAVKQTFPPGSPVLARVKTGPVDDVWIEAVVIEYARPQLVDDKPVLGIAVFAETQGPVGAIMIGLDACMDIATPSGTIGRHDAADFDRNTRR